MEIRIRTVNKKFWTWNLARTHGSKTTLINPKKCKKPEIVANFQSNTLFKWTYNLYYLLEQARSIISLATERSENFLSSRLLLPRASVDDGGNYTCVPTEALPVSVFVHVLNGNDVFQVPETISPGNLC